MTETHYLFAHRMMPDIFFRDPGSTIDALVGNGQEILEKTWDALEEKLGESSDRSGLSVSAHAYDAGGHIIVITMPPPQEPAEAYFMALVVIEDQDGPEGSKSGYFTLENAPTSSTSTVFGAWEASGRHLNGGEGTKPDPDLFLEDVIHAVEHGRGWLGGVVPEA